MMKYSYFVSYVFGERVLGFGNMQVDRDEPFTNVAQIQAQGHALTRDGIAANVTILNVVLLAPEQQGGMVKC
jgi:hypothetical protein